MGKKSLIKSTSKKKEDEKKAAAKKKMTAAKKSAAKPKKKAKAAPKAKKAVKAKTPAKSKAKAAPKKAPAKKTSKAKKTAKAKKKISIKDLLSKQFDRYTPEKLYVVSDAEKTKPDYKAPPLVAGKSKAEGDKIKSLLGNRYSMEALKNAAEKAAKEKAAAEKAAKEKAAAEKAAAEKAAKEKAAAEKAAAEKAAAEKAAKEKAAAEKAAAEEPQVAVSYADTPPPKKEVDPVERAMKLALLGFGIIILLIVGSSFSNTGNFYLKQKGSALEIYQGRFAPQGEKLLLTLPDVAAPEPLKEIYSKKDVYPLVFGYYLDQADTLLTAPGLPDFEGIKTQVEKALAFSATVEMRDIARTRLDKIDRLIFLYKADVAITRGDRESLEAARDHLKEADRLSAETVDEELIAAKLALVDEMLTALEAQEAAEAEAAAQAAAAEEAAQAEDEAAEEAAQAEDEAAEAAEETIEEAETTEAAKEH